MDRLQSGDLRTYLALREQTNLDTEYIPQDDESQARRIRDFTGLGEAIYGVEGDTDASEAFADGFGLEIKHGTDEAASRRFQSDGSSS